MAGTLKVYISVENIPENAKIVILVVNKNESSDYINKLNIISLDDQINNEDYTLVFNKQVFRRF